MQLPVPPSPRSLLRKLLTALEPTLLAGDGQSARSSASQLTAGRALGLAASLLFGLPAQARGWTASGQVQLAQCSGSRLLFFGPLVPHWRWNRTDLPFPIKCPPLGGVRWPRAGSSSKPPWGYV